MVFKAFREWRVGKGARRHRREDTALVWTFKAALKNLEALVGQEM